MYVSMHDKQGSTSDARSVIVVECESQEQASQVAAHAQIKGYDYVAIRHFDPSYAYCIQGGLPYALRFETFETYWRS